jgi:hypothetical protein
LRSGEGTKIVSCFESSAFALSNGVTVDGKKFLTIRANDRSIYGMKVREEFKDKNDLIGNRRDSNSAYSSHYSNRNLQ